MAEFTPRSKPAASCDRKINERSREVRFDNLPAGPRQFFLKLVDYHYDEYCIPLGKLDTQPAQESAPEQYANVYMPVDLRRYTYPEATGAPQLPDDVEALLHDRRHRQFTDQLRPGWIYIFRNGYLWRELQVVQGNAFEEVNLSEYKGKDQRQATTEKIYHPILPYKLNGKVQQLEIAYSEIQWPWAYINHYGGMEPGDPRISEGSKPGLEFHSQLPEGVPKPPPRALRMQNITALLVKADSVEYEAPETGPLPEKPENFDWFKLHNHDYLFTIYVLDPIGVARSLANDVATMQYDMLACKAIARKDPKYTMAQLVHQLTTQEPKYKKYIDEKEVLDILRWDDYIKILKRFDLATQALGDYFLTGPFANASAGMTVATAMADYWVTDGNAYLQGLQTLAELLANLQLMSGAPRLEKLFADNNPLIKNALNPSQTQIQTIIQDHLEAAAVLIQNIAGAAVMHKSVRKYVFEYSRTLVARFTHGEYTLEKTKVNLSKVLQAEEKVPKSLELLKQSYYYEASTEAKVVQWMTVKARVQTEEVEVPLGKSIKWLKANEPLVRMGAIGLMMAIQAINLGEVIFTTKKQGVDNTAAIGDMAKLVSLNLELYKEIKKDKTYKQYASKVVADEVIKESLGKIIWLTHGFAFVGNAISVCLDFNHAWHAFKQGNDSLATLSAVSGLGDTLLTCTSLIGGASELLKYNIAPWLRNIRTVTAITEWSQETIEVGVLELELTYLSILTMIGFAIIIIAAILIYIFTKSPLEKWLIHGPFGKDHLLRYLGPEEGGTRQWAALQDPLVAQQTLFNLLYKFSLEVFFHYEYDIASIMTINVRCPLFIKDKSKLYFQLRGKKLTQPHWVPQLLSSPQSHVKLHHASGKPITLSIDYDVKYSQYTFEALLDLYGDGRLIIPAVFNDGKQWDQPQMFEFDVPLNSPQYLIAQKEML